MKFVVYSNSKEVILTSSEKEQEILKSFFQKNNRNVDLYYRNEYENFICVEPSRRMHIEGF